MKLIIENKPATLVAAEYDVKREAWRLARQQALAEKRALHRQAVRACIASASRTQ